MYISGQNDYRVKRLQREENKILFTYILFKIFNS